MTTTDRYDVEQILTAKGKRIKRRAGDELVFDCWICVPPDTGGHLYFHRDSGVFLCHKCQAKGNLWTLGWAPASSQSQTPEEHRRTLERSRIFAEAAKFYHTHLPANLRRYWQGRRLSDETIDKRLLGYAPGGVRRHLLDLGLDGDSIRDTGLIKDDQRDFLQGCLTIPYLESGAVVTIRGRRHPEAVGSGAKYLTLPGNEARLFNVGGLMGHPELVLLCEGEPDTMVAAQLGFSAVGVPGAGSFKKEWSGRFPKDVPLAAVFDPDVAGEEGIEKLVEAVGPLVRVVRLPQDLDLNDYLLAGHTKDDLQRLIDAAPPWLDLEIERIKALHEPTRTVSLRRLFGHLAALESIQRSPYEKRVSKAFDLQVADVRREVAEARPKVESSLAAVDSKPTEISAEDREAAETLLRDPCLLDRFLTDSAHIGLVGEDDNKVIIYLALTSRISDHPIDILVKGESSGGKSYLVGKVSAFIPPEDVKEFTALSPRALFHCKSDLAHKVLIIYEHPGSEDADYSIRTLQSEGKLVFAMPVKDPNTGRFETEEIEVQGPIQFIETTTRSHVNPENETRCFELYIDNSEGHTRAIFAEQRKPYLGPVVDRDALLKVWRNAQRLLKPLKVRIPFADLIEFPTKPVRVRRDHVRFLTLIEAVCLLHQGQRAIAAEDAQEFLVATIDDYAIAYELAGKVLLQTIKRLSPSAEELLMRVKDFVTDEAGEPDTKRDFTVREIEDLVDQPNRTVNRLLKDCATAGYLEQTAGGKGKVAVYRYRSAPKVAPSILLQPEELERRISARNLAKFAKPRQQGLAKITACAEA